MVTQTLQCDQIFKVLNMFQANYLSVEEGRMEPHSLSSVALEEKPGAPTEPGTFLQERARRGRGGEARAELEMTTEALAREP